MAYVLDYFNTGDNGQTQIYGNGVSAISFAADRSYIMTSVKLKLYKLGSPGQVDVSIRQQTMVVGTGNMNQPNAVEIASASSNGNTLPDSPSYEWREFVLNVPVTVTIDNVYSIVVKIHANGGNASNYIQWRQLSAGGDATANLYKSINNESSWTSQTPSMMFETYGTHSGPVLMTQYKADSSGYTTSSIYGANYLAQMFTTTNKSYAIYGVRLPIYRVGMTSGETFTVEIWGSTGGKPDNSNHLCTTSAILASGLDTTVPSSGPRAEYPLLVFATHPTLAANTMYAIVIHSTGTSTGNSVRVSFGSSTLYKYGGGGFVTSSTSGVSWGGVSTISIGQGGFQVFAVDPGYSKSTNFAGVANVSNTVTTANFYGQSFTPAISLRLLSCRFAVRRQTLGSTSKLSAFLSAVDVNGLPTGPILATATIYETAMIDLTGLDAEHIPEVFFDNTVYLVAGTKYAIYLQRGGTDSNLLQYTENVGNSTYAGGNTVYKLGAGAWTNDTTDSLFSLWGYEAPHVISQSSSTDAWADDSVMLSVVAGGVEPLTYQWYKDTVLMPGETGLSLLISMMSAETAGTYKCTITNPIGSVDTADIVVNFDRITSQTASPINVLKEASVYMAVAATGSALNYQWYKNDGLLPGLTNYYMSFFAQLEYAGTYKCLVSNIYGSEMSADIVLTVTDIATNPNLRRSIFNLPLDIDRESA